MGGATYEHWPIDEAEKFVQQVLDYVKDNKNCYTIGEAAVECGEYEEVIAYLSNKFNCEFKPIKKAKEIIKARCLKKGMDGETNPTMTIFNLVNNFGMVNTNTKSDITTKGKEINQSNVIDLKRYTDEELARLVELQSKGGAGEA